jgi:hypothetical protein
VIEQIRKRKQEHINEMNENVCNKENFGTKQWWKLVNVFMTKKKGINIDTIPSILHNGRLYENNEDKANLFNDFFIEQTQLENPDDPLPPVDISEHEISDVTVTALDVKTIILNLKKEQGNWAGPYTSQITYSCCRYNCQSTCCLLQ